MPQSASIQGNAFSWPTATSTSSQAITTSGSPWWWLKLIGDPGRSLFMKGLRPLYAKRCRMRWLQLYNMNHVTQAEREAFIARVRRELSALPKEL